MTSVMAEILVAYRDLGPVLGSSVEGEGLRDLLFVMIAG